MHRSDYDFDVISGPSTPPPAAPPAPGVAAPAAASPSAPPSAQVAEDGKK